MTIWRVRLCIAALISVAAVGCRADPQDERFAGTFIARLHAGDSAAVVQLEPGSDLSRGGWASIAPMAAYLPSGSLDTIRLVASERGRDDQGPYRKLTYEVARGAQRSRAEVWLVTEAGRTYVNTVRVSGPAPAAHPGL